MKPWSGLFLIAALAMKCAAQDTAPSDRAHATEPQTTSPAPATKKIDGKGWLRFVPNVLRDQKQI